jgi:hypothetical protein
VIGTAHGCGIVRDGTARAMPRYHVAPGELAAEVARAFAQGDAAHVFPDGEAGLVFPDSEAALVFPDGEAVDG